MRPLALAALAAIFCLSAPGAHPDDVWRGIKIYKKVTKTNRSHPIHQCFGPHGDIYAVELTDEFRDYLRNGPEFNAHRRGHGNGNGQGQGQPSLMAVIPPEDTSWVMPVWAPRSSIITVTSEPAESGYTRAYFPAPGTMRWMFAKCTDATNRQWSAQNTRFSELVSVSHPDGSIEVFTVYNQIIGQDTGCSGIGGFDQIMPDLPVVKGEWEFFLIYLHEQEIPVPSQGQETYTNWRPVYDYRDGKYQCVIHVP
ncbi:MAG: hypothetical protein KA419_21005 [Acidobacteria bacterium]|nr:hypothetical protein [Acidobacteriota bacterium]